VTDERDLRLVARFDQARQEPIVAWSLRHGAVVLQPRPLAGEQQRRLRRLVERHRGEPSPVERPPTPKARSAMLSPVRLQRLLALPRWIGERPGITRDEVAAAFGATREEIDAELELLDLIDVPGVGSLGRIEEVGGQLEYLRYVEEPVAELTPTDALRLLLLVEAGAAVLIDEQAPGLRSIAGRLRAEVPATVALELAGFDHPDLRVLKGAIRDGLVVRFQYKGRKDADWRDRQVVPTPLRVANGAVYLAGTDVVAGEDRNFRLDRLSNVELADAFPAQPAGASRPAYVPTQPEVETVLLASTRATWLVTQVSPVASRSTDDGGAVMVVRTDAVDWLLSHVMAAGGEAEVVEPPQLRHRILEAATGLLERAEANAPIPPAP
jgi:predicted DNA-binding transcriptional regulator YafY